MQDAMTVTVHLDAHGSGTMGPLRRPGHKTKSFNHFCLSQATFYMGPSWAPVGPQLGMLLGYVSKGHNKYYRLLNKWISILALNQ